MVALTALWERTDDLMLWVDRERIIRYANARARADHGDVVTRRLEELFEPGDRAQVVTACLAAFTSEDASRFEARGLHCELIVVPTDEGSFAILRGVAVGAARSTSSELRRLQRLAAVGQLAGGVAHDFNNLLMVILSHAELAREALTRGGNAEPALAQIRSASERASVVAKQLLALSRPGDPDTRTVSLKPVLFDLLRMIERLIPATIALDYQRHDANDTVDADVGQLQQVLLNLCLNARDAMPDGGRLSVTTELVDVGKVRSAHGLTPGSYVAIRVTDTGGGMDEATRSRIFEPFYTTKPEGRGVGLGLSVSESIVRQHGGAITAQSVLGSGSTFEVLWPYSSARLSDEVAKRRTPAPTGSETVLVAEDEEMVRALLSEILREAGYHVLQARDGLEAVEMFGAHADQISLVVLDAIMPRLDGRGAYERIAAQAPEMRFLLSSGYGAEQLDVDTVALPGVYRLDKPYVPAELLRAVRAALS